MSALGGQGRQVVNTSSADAAAVATTRSGAHGRLCAVHIMPTGAVTPTITVFDNASAASGTALVGPVKIESGKPLIIELGDEGVEFANGLFVHADAWTTVTVSTYLKQ